PPGAAPRIITPAGRGRAHGLPPPARGPRFGTAVLGPPPPPLRRPLLALLLARPPPAPAPAAPARALPPLPPPPPRAAPPLACPLPAAAQAALERAFPDLPPPEFGWTTTFRSAGNGDGRLYLVEQDGLIQSFVAEPDVSSKQRFLDIRDRVYYDFEPDPGMIGLAFHPNYESSGHLFVTYFFKDEDANTVNWRLSRFSRDDAPAAARPGRAPSADPGSEVILIELPLPAWSHAGGDLH